MKLTRLLIALLAILALAPAVYAEDAAPADSSALSATEMESIAPAVAAMATPTSVYKIDPAHSRIGFSVTHMLVSETEGSFSAVEGDITFDRNAPESFKAIVTIQADSIDTGNDDRDKHLKNADFFDAEKFPTITFAAKSLRTAGSTAEIVGDLTIKGVTKEIVIPAVFSGPIKSPFGGQLIGIKGETKINRQDFGVSWNKPMSEDPKAAADKVVGDEVTVTVKIEAKM